MVDINDKYDVYIEVKSIRDYSIITSAYFTSKNTLSEIYSSLEKSVKLPLKRQIYFIQIISEERCIFRYNETTTLSSGKYYCIAKHLKVINFSNRNIKERVKHSCLGKNIHQKLKSMLKI
jgi:hypothetical protein